MDHISELREAQWYDVETVERRQLDRFSIVAKAGMRQFPFYRTMVAETGMTIAHIQSLNDLKQWPLMYKKDLNRAVQDLRESNRILPPYTLRMTAGSTGDPCLVMADRMTSSRSLAVRALFQEWYGIRLGDRQIRLWGHPLLSGYYRELFKGFILNRIRIDSLALSKDRFVNTFNRIANFGAEYLYGYASLIALFIDSLNDEELERIHFTLKAAISTSETMTNDQRLKLQRKLGRPIVDEYGCSEIDIISFCCPEGGRHTAAENIIVEVVRSGDEPEGYGKVVITDLNNTLMPVIRYCIGDLVPLERPECSCGRGWPCIGPVLGRIQNQFIELESGSRVHSQFVVYILEQLFDEGWGIGRFQIVQKDLTQLTLRVVPVQGKPFDVIDLQRRIEGLGRPVLGSNMHWNVNLVDISEIEKSSSYKYQHFINDIQK